MNKKKCLQCGMDIVGRVDKKFCSDYCRNAFHNEQNKHIQTQVRRINKILRKNRNILEECNPAGKKKINRQKLLQKGFNFHYFTNIYRTNTGREYYFCYEHGYLPLENGEVVLVVNETEFA